MKYLLDTNVCVEALRQRNQNIITRLATTALADKFLCPIVQAELYFGAYKSRNPANLLQVQVFIAHFQTLPFDRAAAQKFGEIRAELQRQGRVIGPYDLQIAAIAQAHGATLVTHNTTEFSRIAGLLLEDWQIP
jgi:tRNA(fMet)-specific endonuclease VapC